MFILAYFLLTGCQEGVADKMDSKESTFDEKVEPKKKLPPASAAIRRKLQKPQKMKKQIIVPTFRAMAWPTNSMQL